MALQYVEGRMLESPIQDAVNENIKQGLLVTHTKDGVEVTDKSNHDHVSGIAPHYQTTDIAAEHRFDFQSDVDDFKYKTSGNKSDSDHLLPDEDDRLPVMGFLDGARLYPPTVAKTSSDTSSPSIDRFDVVGVVDSSVNDAPDEADAEGRIVEEGWSSDENNDSSSTTFNESNGNFIPLGRAVYAENDFPITSFDERVWVVRDKGLTNE